MAQERQHLGHILIWYFRRYRRAASAAQGREIRRPHWLLSRSGHGLLFRKIRPFLVLQPHTHMFAFAHAILSMIYFAAFSRAWFMPFRRDDIIKRLRYMMARFITLSFEAGEAIPAFVIWYGFRVYAFRDRCLVFEHEPSSVASIRVPFSAFGAGRRRMLIFQDEISFIFDL